MPTLTYYVDGGVFERNPSPEGVYWSVFLEEESRRIIERQRSDAYHTNNEAEWLALRAALKDALERRPDGKLRVLVFSDSQIVVNQFNRRWQFRTSKHLLPFGLECWGFAQRIAECFVRWAPRAEMVKRLGH